MESGTRRNQTLICAPLMADTVDQMLGLMLKAKNSGADLVEVRLDHLKSFNPSSDIEILIKHCPLPTLFTYRFHFQQLYYCNVDEFNYHSALLSFFTWKVHRLWSFSL